MRHALAALAAALLAAPALAQSQLMYQCGTVEAGVTCPKMFRADDQTLWLLDVPLTQYQVGDRLRVRGTIVVNCITTCGQGDGCIMDTLLLECSPVGESFCPQYGENSTGQFAEVVASGSAVVADDDLTLTARRLPPGSFAYFIASETQGFLPTPGVPPQHLCLAGSISRLHAQVGPADAAGVYAISTDPAFGAQAFSLAQFPTPNGFVSVMAGETWSFQCWHRDVTQPPFVQPTSDFTEGVAITFQ